MKNYILVSLFFSVMLQSCTSYRTVSNDVPAFVEGTTYKIKQGEKWMKVKVISSDESTIQVRQNHENKSIDRSSITSIKERKFSVTKTILLVPVVVSAVAIGAYIADPEINIPISPSSPN